MYGGDRSNCCRPAQPPAGVGAPPEASRWCARVPSRVTFPAAGPPAESAGSTRLQMCSEATNWPQQAGVRVNVLGVVYGGLVC